MTTTDVGKISCLYFSNAIALTTFAQLMATGLRVGKYMIRPVFIGSCWAVQIGGVPGAIGAAQACAKAI